MRGHGRSQPGGRSPPLSRGTFAPTGSLRASLAYGVHSLSPAAAAAAAVAADAADAAAMSGMTAEPDAAALRRRIRAVRRAGAAELERAAAAEALIHAATPCCRHSLLARPVGASSLPVATSTVVVLTRIYLTRMFLTAALADDSDRQAAWQTLSFPSRSSSPTGLNLTLKLIPLFFWVISVLLQLSRKEPQRRVSKCLPLSRCRTVLDP